MPLAGRLTGAAANAVQGSGILVWTWFRSDTPPVLRRSIMVRSFWLIAAVLVLSIRGPLAAEPANRVTILYDAFGKDPAMKKDWGFSALVEYGGRRVLFDTGNDAEVFAKNVKAAGIDLKKLDFVVISHRHLDHTAGLSHLLSVNPGVKIYVPQEVLGGVFGTSAPGSFFCEAEPRVKLLSSGSSS
jgi:glyoxylase-like metal-dependent hydrolase (beta-lactamase superfamily II)